MECVRRLEVAGNVKKIVEFVQVLEKVGGFSYKAFQMGEVCG